MEEEGGGGEREEGERGENKTSRGGEETRKGDEVGQIVRGR